MMNSNVVLTTLSTFSTTTTMKKHKKYNSKKTDDTKEKKKKKKHKKSRKSKSKTALATVTSGSRWTTILTEITKNNKTDATYHLSTAKDALLPSTPSYFSLPKHTHITEHPKLVTLSNIQTGSSGIVSPTILNIPVTTISDSNFVKTTKSSTPFPPSSQSSTSTVSSVNRDINTTTSNLSIMSTSRLITSTSETSNSVSKSIKSDYKKATLISDTAVSKSSTLLSSSLATSSKQLIPSTTTSNVADQDNKITSTTRLLATTSKLSQITEVGKSSSKNNEGITTISVTSNKPKTESTNSLPVILSSTLSTVGTTTSNVPIKTTSKPFIKPYNSDRLKASNIRAGDSVEDVAEEESTTLTTQKTTIETSPLTKSSTISSSHSVPLILTETPSDLNIKNSPDKSASERHLGSSEKIETVTEAKSSTYATPVKVESSSSTTKKDLETTESEKRFNTEASSTVDDQSIEVAAIPMLDEEVSSPKGSLRPNNERTSTFSVTSNKPTTESTNSVDTSIKLSSTQSPVHLTKTTTKPFIKPHHFDNLKASNIRAGDSSEEESGEEQATLTTQKTTSSLTKSSLTKSSTISSSYSVPLIVSEKPSDSNNKDKSGKAASERHLGSSEKVELVTESSSPTREQAESSSILSSIIKKDLEPTESEKSLTEADQHEEVTASNSPLTTSKLSLTTEEVYSSKLSSTSGTIDTTISDIKHHHLDVDDAPGKALERHLGSSEKIEQVTEMSLSSPSLTPIKPLSLSTSGSVKENPVTNDVFAKDLLQSQNNPEVDTTLLNIPATPETFSYSSEPVNSTIINLLKSSLLTTETPFPTASSASKLINTEQLTQSSELFESVTTSLAKQGSTITPATRASKKLNHAVRFEDDDNDSGLVIQQQVDENGSGSNEEEDEIKLKTIKKTVQESAEETEEETLEATEEEPVKKLAKKPVPLIRIKGKSKNNPRPRNSRRPMKLAVKV